MVAELDVHPFGLTHRGEKSSVAQCSANGATGSDRKSKSRPPSRVAGPVAFVP
jgi:hypothetical protein